jgi:uncharacterized metal-binding protein YceD (DUF177 family)
MAIKINIGSLKEGSQEIELEVLPAELGLELNSNWKVKGNVGVKLELFKTSNQLDIKVIIKGILELECSRCLDLFEKALQQELELVYVQKSPREEAFNDDYYRTYNPHMKTVDITNDIKEMILLAVPMRQVPEENQDGSCSWCGKTKEYWHQFIVDEEELENK